MNYEKYAARVRRMNPIDDDFLRKMAEDKDFCQEVIQTILEEPHLVVVEVKSQDAIKNLQGRSVVLDAHCVTRAGKHINVEVQKSDDDDHQKRVRYNAACVTANITDTGSKFENVPAVCVIYITKNDFLKKGKTTYHIDRVIRETGDVVYNGFSEIYVNAYVKDGSPTSELMTIFTEDNAYDDRKFPATSQRKRYFKEDKKGVSEMSAIMQEIVQDIKEEIREECREEIREECREEGRAEGLAEGREEGRIETVVAMYHDGDVSLQKACKRLGLTEEEFLEKAKEYQK